MSSADGAIVITFNGEIYNYRELRRQLEDQGCVFRTASDTEVIIQLYERMGEAAIERLRGMFALAIRDSRRGGVLLARDPFGIKPLYYAVDDGVVRFASLAKALLAGGAVSHAVEPAAQVGFLLLGSVPEPFTWWRAIAPLPAGSTLWIDRRGPHAVRRYVDIAASLHRTEEAGEIGLLDQIAQSVRCHMLADVPVGIFLSSGIDSTTIADQARKTTGAPLLTFTVGFDVYRGTDHDETALAARIARALGTDHRQEDISIDDFRQHREAMMAAMDQPTIDGVNTYFVSLAARRAGLKVALSGIGGDELFGGYPSFTQIPALVGLVSPIPGAARLGAGLRRVLAPLLGAVTSPKYAGLLEYGSSVADAYLLRRGLFMPWELPRLLDAATVAEGLARLQPTLQQMRNTAARLERYSAVAWLELSVYLRNQLLRDTDWASMAHSLEIRTPFVDVDLFKALAPSIASTKRPTKAAVLAGMSPELRGLLQTKTKRGFQVPIGQWLQRDGSAGARMRGWRGWALEVAAGFGQGPLAPGKAVRHPAPV